MTRASMPLLSLLFLVLAAPMAPELRADEPALLPPVTEQRAARREADRLFEAGEFAAALEPLHSAARRGDKFAQFRISLVHYFGLVGEPDLVEAYAYATTAQEEGIRVLEQYAILLARELGRHQVDAARHRLYEIDAEMGAVPEGTRLSDLQEGCSGSLLSKNCERVHRLLGKTYSEQYRPAVLPPYAFDADWLKDFNRLYSSRILGEFDQFDRIARPIEESTR